MVQYNVFRAMYTNMNILALEDTDCDVMFEAAPLFPVPACIPESLQPTSLQQSVPHASWIDILPDSRMRDTIIVASGTFDEGELMADSTGEWCEGPSTLQGVGVVVWNDPWLPDGWELTEEFFNKWRFLLVGCSDMLASTNRWRAKRGEAPLVIEL
jgi:hypothetical protein